MSNHPFRSPRVAVEFPIEFSAGKDVIAGSCLNISESGLYAVFATPLDLWIVGELALHFGGGWLGIKARVVRASEQEAGLTFLLPQEDDRVAIKILVKAVRSKAQIENRGDISFIT